MKILRQGLYLNLQNLFVSTIKMLSQKNILNLILFLFFVVAFSSSAIAQSRFFF
jgi:hypothetical protein